MEMLDRIDADKDERLSFEEFLILFEEEQRKALVIKYACSITVPFFLLMLHTSPIYISPICIYFLIHIFYTYLYFSLIYPTLVCRAAGMLGSLLTY